MSDRLQGEIYVERGPAKMRNPLSLDVQYGPQGRLVEPGELVKGQEEFFLVNKQPQAVAGDVGDLNPRSAYAKRF